MNEKNTILYYTRLTFNNPKKLTGKSSMDQVLLDYVARREVLTPHFYEDLSYITYPPLLSNFVPLPPPSWCFMQQGITFIEVRHMWFFGDALI